MRRFLAVPLALVTVALQAMPALGQAEGANRSITSAQPGAFDRAYPEAAAVLNSFDAVYGALFEQLYTDAARVESATSDQMLAMIRSGAPEPTALRPAMPSFASSAPGIAETLAWGHQFKRALYDIFADDRIADKASAVDQAVERYLSRSDLALPAEPKSMSGGSHEHMMMGGHHSMVFQEHFPSANGLAWAAHWFEIALMDPILFYANPEQQREGVANVVSRFHELIASPESMPQQMPTPAAVAPELVREHPRAAAILDNLHILHASIADVLAGDADSRSAGLQTALADVQDPTHMAVNEYDWILNSLRHGIFYQGGPAIGRIDRPERNMSHAEHGGMVMPGMSAPSGAGMPQDVGPDGAAPEQPGQDHSGH
ncbi:MAG: hypothetical protein WD766_10095 [Gemmatimonadota bacterium]